MARRKEFDQSKALDKAMKLFWRKGYEATSMQDLVNGMGIGRGSLYDTFGSKRDLYFAALSRYREISSSHAFAVIHDPQLAESMSAVQKLKAIFDAIIAEAMGEHGRWGCLMVNTAIELTNSEDEAQKASRMTIDAMEQIYNQLLEDAQREGSLPANEETAQLARTFINAFLGLRVLAKMHPERQFMEDSVAPLFTPFRTGSTG